MIKTIKRNSQNSDLLVHLAQGKKLTRLSALTIFGVQNITARISDLRAVLEPMLNPAGANQHEYGIQVTIKQDANGQDYASYEMPCRLCRKVVGRYLSGLRQRRAA
jgi:hypothetical protein